MARLENGRERRKKKERVVKLKRKQAAMKKARTEKITLKRELHGLLKAQG